MTWHRGQSNVWWDKEQEHYIQEQLEQRFPDAEYPVHIYIVSAANRTAVGVQIFNSANIKIIEEAYPEPGDDRGAPHPIASAAMAKVGQIINRLKEQQKL